jgi:hypothetical protein
MMSYPVYAFPWTEDDGSQNTGMTLRDYFAAKALTGIIAGSPGSVPQWLASRAYEIADAMLAERNMA